MNLREAVPLTPGEFGQLEQGSHEELSYRIHLTAWRDLGTPTGVVYFKVLDPNGVDVTSVVSQGEAGLSLDGSFLNTPTLRGLSAGQLYTILVKLSLDNGANKPEFLFRLMAT